MPKQPHLDPRAQVAVDHLRTQPTNYYGAIWPRWLTAALPPRGTKRGWRDYVTIAVLVEIISAHRPGKSGAVFFSGALYQINRGDLARQLCTSPDQISTALTWLEALGVIGRIQHTRLDDDGQPKGKKVYAFPIMAKLQALADEYKVTGKTPKPFYATTRRAGLAPTKTQVDSSEDIGSLPGKGGNNLNCVETQQKHDDESAREAVAQRREKPVNDDRRSGSGGGGLGDDDNRGAQRQDFAPPPPRRFRPNAPPPPAASTQREERAPSTSISSNNGQGHASAPPIWPVPPPPPTICVKTEEQKEAWRKASLICAVWEQGITRQGLLSVCILTAGDRKIAFNFFLQEPQANVYFVLATAINAWWLSDAPASRSKGWDDLYWCRISREMPVFLRSFATGKIPSEIGRHGRTINAWTNLRMYFTASELAFYHWNPSTVPILALPASDLWENDQNAPGFYHRRHLTMPNELLEAEDLRQAGQGATESISREKEK